MAISELIAFYEAEEAYYHALVLFAETDERADELAGKEMAAFEAAGSLYYLDPIAELDDIISDCDVDSIYGKSKASYLEAAKERIAKELNLAN